MAQLLIVLTLIFSTSAMANTVVGKDAIKEHGDLTFSAYYFKNQANKKLLKESIEATKKPWSGWWFPSRDKEMFDMGNIISPLEAYDEMVEVIKSHQGNGIRYRSSVLKPLYNKWPLSEAEKYFQTMQQYSSRPGGPTNTVEFENQYVYSYNEDNWDGVCEGIAFASILEKEPTQCREFRATNGKKIILTPFHQKALLAKKYDFVSQGVKYYGNKFVNEPWNTNIAGPQHDYSDIKPDQLHRLLHYYMKDQGKSIIIDYDASYPVWNVTVYGYDSFIYDEGNGVLGVKTRLYYSDPFNRDELLGEPGNYKLYQTGTVEEFIELYYELEYIEKRGKYVITGSRWTEGPGLKSYIHHPDYVIVPEPAKVVPRSAGDVVNPEIVDFMLNDLKVVRCPGE
jgi:hypothetical protein